jgi:hypothetical protein
MKRALLLLLTAGFLSCGGAEAPAESAATSATDSSAPATSKGFVDDVTRAQGKAREIAAEEAKRVREVDDATKDQ